MGFIAELVSSLVDVRFPVGVSVREGGGGTSLQERGICLLASLRGLRTSKASARTRNAVFWPQRAGGAKTAGGREQVLVGSRLTPRLPRA